MEVSRKVSDFEMAVYDATRLIPKGNVTSYGDVASKIGRGNARAVGTALSKNPFAPEVPCHRVVRSDGSLGGFNGYTEGDEMTRKERMLREEGVVFISPGKVASSSFVRIFNPPN